MRINNCHIKSFPVINEITIKSVDRKILTVELYKFHCVINFHLKNYYKSKWHEYKIQYYAIDNSNLR